MIWNRITSDTFDHRIQRLGLPIAITVGIPWPKSQIFSVISDPCLDLKISLVSPYFPQFSKENRSQEYGLFPDLRAWQDLLKRSGPCASRAAHENSRFFEPFSIFNLANRFTARNCGPEAVYLSKSEICHDLGDPDSKSTDQAIADASHQSETSAAEFLASFELILLFLKMPISKR